MVYATEVKIAERNNDIKKRLEFLKMEKDKERMRIEKVQVYNFIKDVIIKGIIINKNIGRYLREKEGIGISHKYSFLDNSEMPRVKESYENVKSKLSFNLAAATLQAQEL